MGGLGRKQQFDERSKGFPARRIMPRTTAMRRYWPDYMDFYDQGETGTCVGHAWAHFIEDSPVTHPGVHAKPFEIYQAACERDPWPENDAGDLQFGTSVLAGAQALREEGIVNSYHWCFTVQEIADALLTLGTIVMGTNWYRSMMATRNGKLIVDESSGIAGGHAYELTGVNVIYKTFRVKNSWGKTWGVGGRATITWDDMAKLMAEDGEACVAIEKAP